MTTYRIGDVQVDVDDDHQVVTHRWQPGWTLVACPNFRPADVELADRLGYRGDTWAMSRDHELAHHWLAVFEGWPWSLTLEEIARFGPPTAGSPQELRDWINAEERAVLAYQLALPKPGPRPWDVR